MADADDTSALAGETTSVAETPYGALEYFVHDDPIGRALGAYGVWAAAEIRLLTRLLRAGDVVVDGGANIGTHTLALARRVGPAGRVLAYEPQPRVQDVLRRNVARNGLTQVEVIASALGAGPGETSFTEPSYGTHVNVGGVAMGQAAASRPGLVTVPVEAIDSQDLPACRMLKIDTEGMGAAVLRGAARTVERHRPVLFLECDRIAEAAALLAEFDRTGYAAFVVRTDAYDPDNPRGNPDNFFGVAQESALLFLPEADVELLPATLPGTELVRCTTLDEMGAALLATARYGDATACDRDPVRLRAALVAAENARLEALRTAEAETSAQQVALRQEAAEARLAAEAEARAQAAAAAQALAAAEAARQAEAERAAQARQDAEQERLVAKAELERATARADQVVAEAELREAALRRRFEEVEALHQDDIARLRFRIASLEWQLAQVEQAPTRPISNAEAAQGARPSSGATGELSALQDRIRALETSTSWRITAPIRAARRLFGGR